MNSKDKIRGIFYGLALGDALGAPHEFKCNRKTIYTGKLEHPAFYKNQYGHHWTLEIGAVTDDTEMTMVLLNHIITTNSYDRETMIKEYMDWANSGTKCLGKNTKMLFKGIKQVKTYYKRYDKINPDNQSNGALMRCSPMIFLSEKEIEEDCTITNPNDVCIDTNKVYVNCINDAINGLDAETIILNAYNKALTNDVKNTILEVINNNYRNVAGSDKGWCLHSLWVALMMLRNFDNFTDAVEWCILLLGDTDTNAAIGGALFGAYIGYDKLFLEQEENINILLNTSIRDKKYHPSLIDELII